MKTIKEFFDYDKPGKPQNSPHPYGAHGPRTAGEYEVKIISDIDEIVQLSQGTKWDLQDPHYAEMYAPVTFIFKDGVRFMAFNGSYWTNTDDNEVQPENVTNEQLRSLMHSIPESGRALNVPTKNPHMRRTEGGFDAAWDVKEQHINKIANMLTDDPDTFNDQNA